MKKLQIFGAKWKCKRFLPNGCGPHLRRRMKRKSTTCHCCVWGFALVERVPRRSDSRCHTLLSLGNERRNSENGRPAYNVDGYGRTYRHKAKRLVPSSSRCKPAAAEPRRTLEPPLTAELGQRGCKVAYVGTYSSKDAPLRITYI